MRETKVNSKLDEAIYVLMYWVTYSLIMIYMLPGLGRIFMLIHRDKRYIFFGILIPIVTIIMDTIMYNLSELVCYLLVKVVKLNIMIRKVLTYCCHITSFVIGIMLIAFVIVSFNFKNELIVKVKDMEVYKQIESFIEQRYSHFFKYTPYQGIMAPLVLHNGQFVEELLQDSEDIKVEALNIAKGIEGDFNVCKAVYTWIGENITYDDELSESLVSGYVPNTIGAVHTLKTKKGVCLDFSSLYFKMLEYLGYDVRLITGKAFNGAIIGEHAWNEVYLKDENRWIKVDSTFYGNEESFDSENFDKVHMDRVVAAETKNN